jgi:WXG100 family type VII secretion target
MVTPETVKGVASKFKAAAKDSRAQADTLSRDMENLRSQWEGMTKNRFYEKYEQSRHWMKQFTQLLEDVARQLDVIAERFMKADGQ